MKKIIFGLNSISLLSAVSFAQKDIPNDLTGHLNGAVSKLGNNSSEIRISQSSGSTDKASAAFSQQTLKLRVEKWATFRLQYKNFNTPENYPDSSKIRH
jgi:hypothetical protein